MASLTHDFDKGGDTIITVLTAKRVFSLSSDTLFHLIPYVDPDEEPARASSEATTFYGGLEVPVVEPVEMDHDGLPEQLTSDQIQELGLNGLDRVNHGIPAQYLGHGDESPQKMRYTFRVSSRHLALASRVFRIMVNGPFMESNVDDQRQYQLRATDVDLEAFIIILNIIHGHHRVVPRSISLHMFGMIAMIVDYYKCHEIVDIFADLWRQGIGDEPVTYGLDSMLWLFVSWVFKWETTFQNMARLALRYSKGPIVAIEVSLPGILLDRINSEREMALNLVFMTIYEFLGDLLQRSDCSFECSAMLLGTLSKELYRYNLYQPRIESPCHGHSVESAKIMVNDFHTPHWSTPHGRRAHGCCVVDTLKPVVEKAEQGLHVFDLKDYLPIATDKRHDFGFH